MQDEQTPLGQASEECERVVLVTGLPSFAARRFLLNLVEREPDTRCYALVPEHLGQRLRQTLVDPLPSRVTVLTGDTVAVDLGLAGGEYVQLVEEVTDVYHMASIRYLGVGYEQAREVNVHGTHNVLQAAAEMPNLRRMNHYSTAYVAGDRQGVIMEDELDEGQNFRNTFERTKFEGEALVRRWMDRLPISVYRPSLVVGDTVSGEIDANRMDGPYTLIRAILNTPNDVALPLPGKGDKPLNVVPIDWVCESIRLLSQRAETLNKTFHLTDPNPLSARHLFEYVANAAGHKAPRGRVPYRVSRALMNMPYVEKLFRRHRQFLDDFNQLNLFNSQNTMSALDGVGPMCPPVLSYIEEVVRYTAASDAV